MSKGSFLVYADLIDYAGDLTDEQLGQLFRAMLGHAAGATPMVADPEVRGIWRGVRHQMDEDAAKYDAKCKQLRANASRCKQMLADASKCEQIASDNDNDNDIKKKIIPNGMSKEKAQKHKRGEHGHVLLTDAEMEKLCADYGESSAKAAVEYLDGYIELKGYKAASHYLAIRKWVFDAIREEEIRRKELAHREKKLEGKPGRGQFPGQRTDDIDADVLAKMRGRLES